MKIGQKYNLERFLELPAKLLLTPRSCRTDNSYCLNTIGYCFPFRIMEAEKCGSFSSITVPLSYLEMSFIKVRNENICYDFYQWWINFICHFWTPHYHSPTHQPTNPPANSGLRPSLCRFFGPPKGKCIDLVGQGLGKVRASLATEKSATTP